MSRILIVYASTYGQTERIAHRIGSVLAELGHEVRVDDVKPLSPTLPLEPYDGVIVASSVYYERHHKEAREWVRRNRSVLERKQTAFVSVCGAAGAEAGREEAAGYANKFLEETGWRPRLVQSFGGAFAYTKYWFGLRWVMKRIAKSRGGPLDTSQDHDLADWAAVEEFARSFAKLLAPLPTSGAGAGSV